MDEIYSKGCKALLSLLFIALSSTFSAGFSGFYTTPSDSTAGYSVPPLDVEFGLRHDIAGYAKNYLGLKYRYAGRTPETGFDCSGFTHFVMGTFGISVSPSSVQQSTQGEAIKVKDTQTGDLIFFRRSSRSRISHVALVVSNDENGLFIIHSTSRGIVVDDLMNSAYWRPKIYSARRVINARQPAVRNIIRELSSCDDAPEFLEGAEEIDTPPILNEKFYCLSPLPSLPLQPLQRI
jgi:hypothetical protein